MNLFPSILGQTAPPATASPSPLAPFITMALVFAAMYFLLIRPQKRRDRERKEMISRLKVGDRVLLTSGILGKVRAINDATVIVQIAEKTKIEVVKAAISRVLNQGETPKDADR